MSMADTPATIADLPFFVAGRYLKPDLLGRCLNGEVRAMSGRALVDQVRDLSLGLSALGMGPGDRVALLSESRPEWLVADFAVLTAGAVTVPIYPTVSPEQVGFILRDSGATIAIVSSSTHAEKIAAVANIAPSLRIVLVMDAPEEADQQDDVGQREPQLMSVASVAERGHRRIMDGWGVAREYQERARAVGPDDLATIIYTSGTTGDPKGVMLTHGNIASNVAGVLSVVDLTENDTALSFLPLCHAFERTVSYVCLASGVSIVFAESIDTVARDLTVVRPTVMSGVPRMFEKLYARVLEKGMTATGLRRTIFDRAIELAKVRGRAISLGEPLPAWARLASGLADRMVFSKIRDGIGGRLRWAVSGSAPLNVEIARFFLGVGLPILEGYGLTETAPVLALTPPGRIRFGTVGPPLPNVELRIAPDGEILARGPNVMRGYYGRPDDTAAALRDGWFHTGDIGELDPHGYLRITDRKKELLVTSGGKKIAPQPIEERLRAHGLVAHAILVGDRRHFPAALISPEFAALSRTLRLDETTLRARLEDEDVRAVYQAVVDEVNRTLAQFERIKKFALIAAEFSVTSGELTPTLKVKRQVIAERYKGVIERFYA
ncbi:MAG: long-chain fatty acid--CoA ligase [Acidobacteria bacterium]|nr:long-chain fatty acid--CoA ligase [Acidobacteriota bacterium]